MTHMKQYKADWEKVYSISSGFHPFDLDEPYQWIVDLEKQGCFQGSILDAGCGAGHNAIYLASKGYNVVGVDISSKAIERAKQKAIANGVAVEFVQANVVDLVEYDNRFNAVIDIGCFHSLLKEDRSLYALSLRRVCRADAVVFLRAFSDLNKRGAGSMGPEGVSEQDLRKAFSRGWSVEHLEHKEIEIVVSENEKPKVHAWFAKIRAC